ncbi:SusD/RagB family nutrient-binding outer membrane lipoprotein [Flagellimonas aequoris]|uniref:SusD/RagB family nutrient-binding outer membrane lipoprotein n=1 Tax=Flagellimonas aequoris TaxID=2306997 RepID=A0A418N861_9FLAO|nr:SusD/RagB family nutrient-binding outer membrane lipoprotein [Allomuricauda aequoris]RIV71557.1 SusD/RagB family nutrient-binding outer membrane lipoprotein [Allomuricauda aequoris]TXK03122.1 SusD/RagB family nutrient-binding outer membrane lipoprotein [Allomuricauda aequoris]
MKKYIITGLIGLVLCSSCSKDEKLSELNNDPKNPTANVPDELFFSNAQRNLVDINSSISINNNIFRFLTQYVSSPIYTQQSQYNFQSRTIPSNYWRTLYRDVLIDFETAKQELEAPGAYVSPTELKIKDNRWAIIELLESYTIGQLVDAFGDVPYSEALDGENLTPKYDDASTIYMDLVSRIDNALSALDSGYDSFGGADLIYGGDTGKWIKFGNSLKFKLAMTLSDVDESMAKTLAEEASSFVFQSNEDNAVLLYADAPPANNPLWNDLVLSGRSDYFMANTIVDALNDLEDPRRDIFFSNAIDGEFVGGEYGAGGDFDTTSHFGDLFSEPDLPGNIMDYSEIMFLMADAAARGFNVGGTPDAFYNEAIRASFTYWGLTDEEAALYLAKPEVAYATAEGDFKQKIGTQMWIALFNRGQESWLQWRRFDYPVLNEAPQLTLDDIPVRLTYPIDEQNRNNANREAAASAIGGDQLGTKLFWDLY